MVLKYRAPQMTINFLKSNFSGVPEQVQVLDVACGSGLVAKGMFELGFRNFVGVDSSKAMLELAAQTGFYRDLKLALLGPEPLPAPTGAYDVVILVGALDVGFAPVSVVRELCQAAKPGGLVCIGRGNHKGVESDRYKTELETELQLMEDEGLWSRVDAREEDGYMMDVKAETNATPEEACISGNLYLYRKSNAPDG
ncbi:methyltransferase-like protein 27 [Cololabis saira]|uniref:methyltransferase-like protein 27 n=1 Tax=Cololabis saira TaxID=129043 RepID=UPI002AD3A5F4|nr:methyltransferase-like protein 27 [Cololabis saira]